MLLTISYKIIEKIGWKITRALNDLKFPDVFLYLASMVKPINHDSYIASFAPEVQLLLQQMRETIHSAAPEAEETIAYSMPAFRQRVNIVYYAGFKNHFSLFPTANPVQIFAEELKGYKTSKGTIQFSLDKPLPVKLITRMVKWRLAEVLKKNSA